MLNIKMAESIITKSPERTRYYYSKGAEVRKIGRVIQFNFGGSTVLKEDGKTFEFTVPSDCLPLNNVSAYGDCYNGSSYVNAVVTIYTSGDVQICNSNGSAIQGIQVAYFHNKPILYITEE